MARLLVGISLVAYVLGASAAEGPTIEKTKLIQSLIEESGLEDRIRGLPPLIIRVLVNGTIAAGDPNGVSVPLREIVEATFQAGTIRQKVIAELQRDLDSAEVEQVAAFFRSELGRELVGLEKKAAADGNLTTIREEGEKLQRQNRKDPHRAALLERVDAATYATDIALVLAESMQLGVEHSLLSALYRFDEGSRLGLRARVDAARFRLRGRVSQQMYLTYLYLYREIGNDRLEEYLEFAATEPGVQYYRAIKKGIHGALIDAFRATDQQLAENFKSRDNS